MDQGHPSDPQKPRERALTERQAAEELGLDRLQLHLAAAQQRLGRYDAITHLLMFSDAEVDALAAHLGVKRRLWNDLGAAEQAKIPDPHGE